MTEPYIVAEATEELHKAVEKDWMVYGAHKTASNRMRPGARGFKRERAKQDSKGQHVRKIGNKFITALEDGMLDPKMTLQDSRQIMKMTIPWWLIIWLGRTFIEYVWDTYFNKWSSSARYDILRARYA